MKNLFNLLKKKIVSIILVSSLAASSIATLPMNAFAGSDGSDAPKAPAKYIAVEVDKSGNLAYTIDTNTYTVNMSNSPFAFSDKPNVIDATNKVINPGIVYATKRSGVNTQTVYIIADIDRILEDASTNARLISNQLDNQDAAWLTCSAANAANAANATPTTTSNATPTTTSNATPTTTTTSNATPTTTTTSNATPTTTTTSTDAIMQVVASVTNTADAASIVCGLSDIFFDFEMNKPKYDEWTEQNKDTCTEALVKIAGAYKKCGPDTQFVEKRKKDWLSAVYAAVKVAKKLTYGPELDLEAKLKIAYMTYRIAQFTWAYYTIFTNNQTKIADCQTKADALQEVIDNVYSDRVGDIADQAENVVEPELSE